MHALLAAGDRQQLPVQRHIPVPSPGRPGERLAEGRAMSVTFGVSQRPIHVKNEGRERHFLYIIK